MTATSSRAASPVPEILSRFDKLNRSGEGWTARCPAHEDKVNSLSIGEGEGGRVLLHCHAGCTPEAVMQAIGLSLRDLFAAGATGRNGLALAEYAGAKDLPVEFLQGLGLSENRRDGKPAVRIPYLDADGAEAAVRFRLALNGKNRFRWKTGSKLCLYGLWRLDEARNAGFVVLVEGESDTQTLWHHDIPALGIPGAGNWAEKWADLLEGIPTIYVVVEPDQGGNAVEKWLGTSRIRSRARLVRLQSAKDPSALYLSEPAGFRQAWQAAMNAALPWADAERDDRHDAPITTPYRIDNGALCLEKDTQDGLIVIPLCNFTAQIAEEILLDDGVETTRAFVIGGSLDTGERLPPVRIPAARFGGMTWVPEDWGVRAVVRAGLTVRDQLREAIQKFSTSASQHHVYTHTGWREVKGGWVYLTASGAIGRDGFREGFEVDLGPALGRYSLPRAIDDPREAMRRSLRLLEIAPLTVTAPLWAGTFGAPLASACSLDLTVWLEGFTGTLKSTLAALFGSHFGLFERTSLPGSWSSTANQLERRAFVLKDAVFVVDDYSPTATDAKQLMAKAARLIRSQGNLAGRGRLRSDLSERPDYPPRGLVISTGEQHPPGQSVLVRTLVVPVERGGIDLQLLTEAQQSAARLPHAMAGYIQWLAPQMPTLPALLKETFRGARLRATAEDGHLRIPEVLAHLWVGLDCALRYAEEVGACTHEQAESHRADCWRALLTLGRAQGRLVEGERPTRRFLECLIALLSQRKAVLLPKEDSGEALRGDAALLGWYDEDFVYLLPDAAHAVVARFCRDSGEPFPIRQERLIRDLHEEKLSECNEGRHTKMARVGGRNRRTLCLRRGAVEALLGEDLPCGASTVSTVSGSGK